MNDIQHKEDIQYLVETFYHSALTDQLIGPVFRAANFKLEAHIPVMVAFWETILFDVITYKGNPMLKHLELNRTVPLKPAHFERWMKIWTDTVNNKFEGPIAQKAIVRATSIAQLMEYKINKADQKTGL
ncbi:group III truncated hemoglobin [Pedobacter nyackensis]|uniref:Hemoglobin n=1 Tax=Pedobacter nyackensis TaxID=475255 RepID=A0A1W2ESA8_9SPHI|nr:group III truncated hemoglobin [Pedobacter nyackensis]SMD12525.1 hemoglobin [Pedobacter nyackensis]